MKQTRKDRAVSELIRRLDGITTALSSPLTDRGEIDSRGLERLIDRMEAGGVACLFPLGWNGEGPLLTNRLRQEVLRETCRLARGRFPVMAGVSEQSLPRTVELIRMAEEAGADMILATPPYSYDLKPAQLVEYFTAVARETVLPLVVYENFEIKLLVGIEGLSAIAALPSVIAVKATVPYVDLVKYYHRLHDPDGFLVMSGDEYNYAAALFHGMRAFTMGGPGCFCPRWCVDIHSDAVQGRWTEVLRKSERMIEFCNEAYPAGETAYAVVKYIRSRLEICGEHICSPHKVLTPAQKRVVDAALEKYADVVRG